MANFFLKRNDVIKNSSKIIPVHYKREIFLLLEKIFISIGNIQILIPFETSMYTQYTYHRLWCFIIQQKFNTRNKCAFNFHKFEFSDSNFIYTYIYTPYVKNTCYRRIETSIRFKRIFELLEHYRVDEIVFREIPIQLRSF